MTDSSRPCPCCGQPLTLGLFARTASVDLPLSVAIQRQAGAAQETLVTERLIIASGRCYVRCQATIPVNDPKSPVRVMIWAEVSKDTMMSFGAAIDRGRTAQISGVAACDWPAMPGSTGSGLVLQGSNDGGFPRVVAADDQRFRRFQGPLTHEQYASLYRQVFDGPAEIESPDMSQRHKTAAAWRAVAGEDASTFRKDITPPPTLAGPEPRQVLIAPPMEADGVLLMGTLGCAENVLQDPYEIMCSVRNPSDRFIKSFGDFCYLPQQMVLGKGSIVPEPPHIPGTSQMQAWLMTDPWWAELPDSLEGDSPVRLFAAIPIHGSEAVFAHHNGVDALLELLSDDTVDVSDLDRESCV